MNGPHVAGPACRCSRRKFLLAASGAALLPPLLNPRLLAAAAEAERPLAPTGPGAKYTPTLHAAFVRRRGEYGIRWPGAIYDGAAARQRYQAALETATRQLGITLTLRPEPLYALAEAEQWLADAKTARPDGLLLLLLDRQEHTWPTVVKAADSKIPTVVFAPVGTAFTTNTAPLARRSGIVVCATDDFSQAVFGLKMIKTGAKLREMRFLVIEGKQRRDDRLRHFGTRLRYLPAQTFLDDYQRTPMSDEIKRIAAEYLARATGVAGPTPQDLYNGVKSYLVARQLLEREEGDGITMDCLGALGQTQVSLPCIAWSRMLDHGVPAACEADLGAAVTHALVQFLFDRPGFQQDPVPDTGQDVLIGAHCTCPTRLLGFDQPPEPFDLSHHHGQRDAVPRPVWRIGQRVTVADVVWNRREAGLPAAADAPPVLLISTGTVVKNVAVPPSGGCVVSVMVKLDGTPSLLDYPGFHQLFFYGDFKKELVAFGRLFGLESVVV